MDVCNLYFIIKFNYRDFVGWKLDTFDVYTVDWSVLELESSSIHYCRINHVELLNKNGVNITFRTIENIFCALVTNDIGTFPFVAPVLSNPLPNILQ